MDGAVVAHGVAAGFLGPVERTVRALDKIIGEDVCAAVIPAERCVTHADGQHRASPVLMVDAQRLDRRDPGCNTGSANGARQPARMLRTSRHQPDLPRKCA